MAKATEKRETWEIDSSGRFSRIVAPRSAVSLHSLMGDRFLLSGQDQEPEIIASALPPTGAYALELEPRRRITGATAGRREPG